MYKQIALDITPCQPYQAESFVVHSGVVKVLEHCLIEAKQDNFGICVIRGGSKSGKTHLSIKLYDEFSRLGLTPRLLDGFSFEEFLAELGAGANFPKGTALILDDADEYFSKLHPGNSGEFVNLVEALRRSRSFFVLLTAKPLDSFDIDEHILSRIRPGLGFEIGMLEEAEVAEILKAMLHQRGISLTEKKLAFLEKRVSRDIAALADTANFLLAHQDSDFDSFEVLGEAVSGADK